jgi:hypothetical protein
LKSRFFKSVLSRDVAFGMKWTRHQLAPAMPSQKVIDRCACRKLNPGILVMQSAQDWATKNVPGAIDGARDRCFFLQG